MKNSNKILFIIFFATVIPTIYVYLEHSYVEWKAYDKSVEKGDDYKATKQYGEATLFLLIGLGYVGGIVFLILGPEYKFPYIVLIVGTIAVIILYFLRIYGIPIPFTDVVIRDLSTTTPDVITKICQTIMLPVLTLLAVRRE